MIEVRDVLEKLGYRLIDDGFYWRSAAIYRNGDNQTALRIRKENGRWYDFVTRETGSLLDLVNKSSGDLEFDLTELEKFGEVTRRRSQISIMAPKFIDNGYLLKLEKKHDYWLNRGIDLEILNDAEGGVCSEGRFDGYYVFPIFDRYKRIIGLSGRNLNEKSKRPKWKHFLQKYKWIYNAYQYNKEFKDTNVIYLVESIGDLLSLYTCGLKASLCLFGLSISVPLLNFLIRVGPDKIGICLNNDEKNNSAGNLASDKLYIKLAKFFNKNQIEKFNCPHKDYNDFLIADGKEKILDFLT